MKYIDYNNMKEFYTIEEVCRLFELDKQELRQYSRKYGIEPQEDQYGNWGFRKMLVRRLHNHMFRRSDGLAETERRAPAFCSTPKATTKGISGF